MELDVTEASSLLGVTSQRVRDLIHDGALPARRVAGRFVVDEYALLLLAENRSPGRPLSPRNAWGLISLLESGHAPDLMSADRSKLRRRLRDHPNLGDVARWTRRRSVLERLHVHPGALRRAITFPGAVRTGASAQGHDVIDPARAEIYLPRAKLAALRRQLHAEPVDSQQRDRAANLIVHIPAVDWWPFDGNEAGTVTVAIDLWDAGDTRSRRASRRLYDAALRAERYEVPHR